MYIQEVRVQDLRCFEGTHTINLSRGEASGLAGWTVLAGRNGSGKSSLLKAIAMSVLGPRALLRLNELDGWVHVNKASGGIETRVVHDPSYDLFSSKGRTATPAFWTGLSWRLAPTRIESSDSTQGKSPDRGPWSGEGCGWFVAGYGPFRHLGPGHLEAVKASRDPVLARVVNLFHEGASLVDAVDWLQDVHTRALEGHEAERRLKRVVLELLNEGLLPDGSQVRDVNSDGLWIERDGVVLPIQSISDGYRAVVALVLDLVRLLHSTYPNEELFDDNLRSSLPGVVLIDEIDAHMHVSWQQHIGFWLRDHFPALQFIVSTHSPFICQAASPRGIIRLPAPGEDRRIEHITDELFRHITQGGVDGAVMSELFGLEHAHSSHSEALRERLAQLEARLLQGHELSDRETEEMKRLQSRLPNTLGDIAERDFRAVMSREP